MDASRRDDFGGMPGMETARPASGEPQPARTGRIGKWLRKMGVAGFLFFTVKGLLWLIIPAVAANLMT